MATVAHRRGDPDQHDAVIERAVRLLRIGEVIGLPTETVYGLAAGAFNPDAVAKIFAAKDRPRFDPLIIHLPHPDALDQVATVESQLVWDLIQAFWPGPLTIILSKRDVVPDIATAGLSTVAVRISEHPIFREISATFGQPIAAPSANRFGRISPTTAGAVFEELNGLIPLIVDAGPTRHGIESTIVQIVEDRIEILRQGPITANSLRKLARVQTRNSKKFPITAPGQTSSHYAPRTRMVVVDSFKNFSVPRGLRAGALCFESVPDLPIVRQLSREGELREAAANLFRMLRELDNEKLDLIVAELVPEQGIGSAINDRLRRAAAGFQTNG